MEDPVPDAGRRHEVRTTILALAASELDLPEAPDDNTDLAESLDSIQRLSLVVSIEDHFEVCFEPEDDEGIRTLGEAIDAVVRLLDADRSIA
jgi:acyl carrier protein